MRFGFHISIAGGFPAAVRRATALGCETVQIFSGNPRGWAMNSLDQAGAAVFCREAARHNLVPVVVHMPYLPNLASPDMKLYERSVSALQEELRRAAALGADYLVTHIGHRGPGAEAEALARVARAIDAACGAVANGVVLLLENTAGQGSEVGSTFGQLGCIVGQADHQQRIGICLDTAHALAAGYDIARAHGLERALDELDRALGIKRLRLVHLNDSKAPAGARVDRHAHIGAGCIGRSGLRRIINHPLLKSLPAIMETPKESDQDDLRNMQTVRTLAGAPRRSPAGQRG